MVTKSKSAKKRTVSTTKNKPAESTAPSTCKAIQISIKMGVLIALAVFLLTSAWGIQEYIHTIQEPAEMSFTGSGEHLITNNTAKITFSFSDLQQDITAARDTVITRVQNAYTLLTQANITETDIQTTGYTIYPEYERPTPIPSSRFSERPSNLLGYRVSHTTTVTIKEVEKIGTILAMLTDLNPETITGPHFSADAEQEKYAKDVATIKAIHDAKIRAYKITKLSNLRLKKITRINVYENNTRPYARLESASATFDTAEQQAVPIQQGEQKIQQTATITYEIEERRKRRK